MATSLPTIHLKTRTITFDDRLGQVRVVHHSPRSIEFHDYNSEKGQRYLRRYRG